MSENLSELTNDELIQTLDRIGTNPIRTFVLGGSETKPLFYIQVKVLEPIEGQASIASYETLGIKIFFWEPMPPAEDLKMDDLAIDATNDKGEPVTYKFTFDVRCFPHKGIDPHNHPQFKTQEWSKLFRYDSIGYIAKVDKPLLCDIIRYCDKIGRLSMFW